MCRRKTLELAWAKVKKHRGRAGLDAGPSAPLEARQEDALDLRHRTRRDGTSRPNPGNRGEMPQAAGGVRTLGLPAVRARGGPQGLVPRRAPSVAPTGLDRSLG